MDAGSTDGHNGFFASRVEYRRWPAFGARRVVAGLNSRALAAAARRLAPLLAVFLAYYIAGKLGQATTSIRSSNLGPVWPAYGIALAALLRYGYGAWPAVAASAFVVAVQGSVSSVAAAGQAAGATLAAAGGAFLLRRIPDFNPSLVRLRDALGLIVLGAFVSAIVSASVGVMSLYATGVQAYKGLASAWLIYWLGDSTGVLLVTPLVFTLPDLVRTRGRPRTLEMAALLILLTAACFVVFGDWPLFPIRMHVLAFAVLPFVMWAAIAFGVGGAALSTVWIAGIATVLTALGSGPFAQHTPFTNAVLLDVLFIVLSITGLTLAALIVERERAEREREAAIREQTAMQARLHLAAIVESSEDAIWSQDLDGVIRSWNAAAERILGFTAAEAVGQTFAVVVPPELQEDEAKILRRLIARDRIVHRETSCLTRTGARVGVSLTVSPLRDPSGNVVGIAKVARDISEQLRARETLSAVNRSLIEAQERERTRIARELHDDIGQRLALVLGELRAAESGGLSDLSGLQAEVAQIAVDVHALSRDLHPSRLGLLGLAAASRSFCRTLAEQQKVTIDVHTAGVPRHLPPDASLVLYRILQEALHNCVKHSRDRRFEVRLWSAGDALHMVVRDRGVGFDVGAAGWGPGIGLVSMQERIKLVSGELSITSAPHQGTAIHARVPLSPA
jgi:PAS domain S-box-containing protein